MAFTPVNLPMLFVIAPSDGHNHKVAKSHVNHAHSVPVDSLGVLS